MNYREDCRTCEGAGTVVIESTLTYPEGDPEVIPCEGCDGLGAILTQEGHKLIEFLELVSPEVLGRRVPRRRVRVKEVLTLPTTRDLPPVPPVRPPGVPLGVYPRLGTPGSQRGV